VTDANLLLEEFQKRPARGAFELDMARTIHFMMRARARCGRRTICAGILDVANSVMEKAIRVISVERGHDPRDYTLVAFGGAGALHAAISRRLEIPRVLVRVFRAPFPRWAFCALT